MKTIKKECTMAMGCLVMKTKKFQSLSNLYKFLFNKEKITKHRALSDVKTCCKCFYEMKNKLNTEIPTSKIDVDTQNIE